MSAKCTSLFQAKVLCFWAFPFYFVLLSWSNKLEHLPMSIINRQANSHKFMLSNFRFKALRNYVEKRTSLFQAKVLCFWAFPFYFVLLSWSNKLERLNMSSINRQFNSQMYATKFQIQMLWEIAWRNALAYFRRKFFVFEPFPFILFFFLNPIS